jgi:hypothetical protein
MRHSNHATLGRPRRTPAAAGVGPGASLLCALLVVLAIGCGTSAAPVDPTPPSATPVVTPDPHLREPVTADQIYLAIAAANPAFRPSNAIVNQGPIVKRINADLSGWPVRITAYTSSAALRKAFAWTAGDRPSRGEPPYAFAALNISVEYGPSSGLAPSKPDATHQAIAVALLGILDPLLWPIEQHSVMAIPGRTIPPPSHAPAPTKTPKAPRPSPTTKP